MPSPPVPPFSPFPSLSGCIRASLLHSLPSCHFCSLCLIFCNFTLYFFCMKGKRASSQSHTFFHFISLPLLPPLVFFFPSDSRAAWQAYSPALGAAQQPPRPRNKLFFYSQTVALADPSFHTCLTHTHGGDPIFSQIFRRPQKC